MQTAQAQQPFTIGNKKQLSSFELITNWIDVGYTLGLSPNALQLMTVLLRFYNPEKKFVFPHQSTLAERTNTSLATVKRGLNDLIKAQLIVKSRTKLGNVYGFTAKLFELLNSSICTIGTAQNEPCMNRTNKREQIKEHQHEEAEETKQVEKVVVSLSNFSLKRVPQSILAKKTDRNGKPIRSHAAYWNSFTDEQKREYLKAEEAESEKLKQKEELKKQREAEEIKKRAEEEKRKEELNKPLGEQFSRQQAIKHVWQLRNLHRGNIKPGLTKSLVDLYNLDVASICKMSEQEMENIL